MLLKSTGLLPTGNGNREGKSLLAYELSHKRILFTGTSWYYKLFYILDPTTSAQFFCSIARVITVMPISQEFQVDQGLHRGLAIVSRHLRRRLL